MVDHKIQRRNVCLSLALAAILPAAILFSSSNAAAETPKRAFAAHLSGSQEVPPVDTNARGAANFQLSADGTELHYRLIVSNINDVAQAHIHVGAPGVNGPVVAFLFGPSADVGRVDGVLAVGTITSSDLLGPLAGQPLSDLIDEIRAGNAYVNVHTVENPDGEIRGQIM